MIAESEYFFRNILKLAFCACRKKKIAYQKEQNDKKKLDKENKKATGEGDQKLETAAVPPSDATTAVKGRLAISL